MNDLRYAIRQLIKDPGFTIAVVLTLAIAIGGNTAIFSVLDGVLLRPAPFAELDRLVMVWETDRNSGTSHEPGSVPDFLDYREQATQFTRLAAVQGAEAILTPLDGQPVRMPALGVSHDFLPMVGIAPVRGRGFTAEDDVPGAAGVVLIGERFWERQYARSDTAIGATLSLSDRPVTIVGVVPDHAGFGAWQIFGAADYARVFADRGERADVEIWFPLQPNPAALPRSTHPIFMMGRLASSATPETAQKEMTQLAADLERTYPENTARGARVEKLEEVIFGPVRPALLVLLAAVAVVLIVACANVANLLLARGTARIREVAVRTALGAGAGRLARQFLIEGVLLASIGGAVGIMLAVWGTAALLRLAPADIPRLAEVGVNGRVLGVTVLVSLLVGIVFGLVPTLQAMRSNLQGHLKGETRGVISGGRTRARVRAGLVVAQLALSVVLVIGAGLLLRSFWQLQQVDTGFRPDRVLKAEFLLPRSRYPVNFANWPNFAEIHRFNDELLSRARSLPGVSAAAIAGNHPLDPGSTNSFVIVGREAEAANWPEISVRRVSEGYFETVGLPVRDGRGLTTGDGLSDPPAAVLNGAATRLFFAAASPIGQQIRFWGTSRTIVGVVADERFQGLANPAAPAVYVPTAQVPAVNGAEVLLLRTAGPPAALAEGIRSAVRGVDPALAVYGIEPLANTVSRSLGRQRFTMLLLGAFAGVAVLLALIGIHGMLTYLVARRGAELGIRLALGATRRSVAGLVLRQGLSLALLGIAVGLLGAYGATRLLRALVFGVTTTDPATFVAVALIVPVVTLFACWLPAQRATRIDPMEALRNE